MEFPSEQATLQQLAAVPGVVGSMVFGSSGTVVASAFPPVFDLAGLQELAAQLSADGYFQEWMAGDKAALDLRYRDGRVVLRSLDGTWLLVLSTAHTNTQLLAMSLTQAVRRLKVPAGEARAPVRSVLDRLRAIASGELGDHAAQALEILAAAGSKPKELLRATSDIERMTRLFINKKKADEIGRRMRDIIEA